MNRVAASYVGAVKAAVAIAFLFSSLISAGARAEEEYDFSAFDAYVEQEMQKWRVPGIAVAIVKKDRVLHMRGYGVREIGKPGAVDADTVFAVGSNGKSFTSVMIGALQDKGLLNYKDPIATRLPGFRMVDPYATYNVTFEDALGHMTGLPEQSGLGAWYLLGASPEEMVKLVASIPPASPYRGRFAYNNTMFTVAAAAASAVTGKSYDELMKQYVLGPLGMARSGMTLAATKQKNVASPHAFQGGQPVSVPYHPIVGAAAAGALNSSVRDMSKYVRMLMNDGEVDGHRILSPETAAQMQTERHIFVDDEMMDMRGVLSLAEDPARAKSFGYGLGIGKMVYDGADYSLHGGGIDGMTSWMVWSAEDDIGFIALTNSGNIAFPALLMFKALNPFIGLPDDDALTRMEPAIDAIIADAPTPQPDEVLPAIVGPEALVGRYSNINGAFNVRIVGDQTIITLEKMGYKGELAHVSGPLYWIKWENPALPGFGLEAVTGSDGDFVGLREAEGDGQFLFPADRVFLLEK